jgi:hypothetical protein
MFFYLGMCSANSNLDYPRDDLQLMEAKIVLFEHL